MSVTEYFLLGTFLAYVLAAVAGAWRLKQLGYRRFLPLGPLALTVLPWLSPPDAFGEVLLPLIAFVLLYATLRITWSVPDPAARVLRVLSATFLGYTIFILLAGVI